jgi:hypothetical protein
MTEENKTIDPFTGEAFFATRINQRFSVPENRIKFHNKAASNLRKDRAFLDKPAKKNHLIIIEIYVDGKDNIFNSYWLEGKGFRFDATNHQVEYEGMLRNCVYEFILIEIEGTDDIKIIKNDRF